MKIESRVANRLSAARKRLGMSQVQISEASGVARQTISGIESGEVSPSTSAALRLARVLGCRVEDLFFLEDDSREMEVQVNSESYLKSGTRVQIARIGSIWVAQSLDGDQGYREEIVPADGVVIGEDGSGATRIRMLSPRAELEQGVVIAGCAPALSLWARSAERWEPNSRVCWTHANSTQALRALSAGTAHIAGMHLFDGPSTEFNTPFIKRQMPNQQVTLVNLGIWEEGFAVKPVLLERVVDLASIVVSKMRLVNRDAGSGCRKLLDDLLDQQGVVAQKIIGYSNEVKSHRAIAQAIVEDRADIGVCAASAAWAYGLGFVPLRSVRYDLAIRTPSLNEPPIRRLIDSLQHPWVMKQLQLLGGFETRLTGETVAVLS